MAFILLQSHFSRDPFALIHDPLEGSHWKVDTSSSLWLTLGSQSSSPPGIPWAQTPCPAQRSEGTALPPAQGLGEQEFASGAHTPGKGLLREDDITQILGPLGKGLNAEQ